MDKWINNNLLNELHESIENKKEYAATSRLTWEESKQICKTPYSFIKYLRAHRDEYYSIGEFDKVESSLKFVTEYIFGEDDVSAKDKAFYKGAEWRKNFYAMLKEYFKEILSLGEDDEVEVYRGLKLDSDAEVDWDNIGNCWSYDESSVEEFLNYFTDNIRGSKNYIIQATTDRDNIDWILSICLNLTHINEKELRLYDGNDVYDPYCYSIDE